MNIINNISGVREKCCQCNNCINVCRAGAISYAINKNGTAIPLVNNKCVNCGKCYNSCPVINISHKFMPFKQSYFWFVNKNTNIVSKSSSGGMFYEIAKAFLESGGIVFASKFDSKKLVFDCFDEISKVTPFLKSKYVESRTQSVFIKVKQLLDSNKRVLFVGAPCQVAALKLFVNDSPNLMTVDFVCGGMPLEQIYNSYIEELEKKYQSKIKSIDFRPKSISWKIHQLRIVFENGKHILETMYKNPYMYYFVLKKRTVRESCIDCLFKDKHMSDIVIADYWMANKQLKEQFTDGISLVIINSRKGSALFEEITREGHKYGQLKSEQGNYVFNKSEVSEESKKNIIAERNSILSKGVINQYKSQSTKEKIKLLIKDFLYRTRLRK